MLRNMHAADRIVRLAAVAPLSLILGLIVGLETLPGLLLVVLCAFAIVTSLAGYCPLYQLLHLSTSQGPRRLHS